MTTPSNIIKFPKRRRIIDLSDDSDNTIEEAKVDTKVEYYDISMKCVEGIVEDFLNYVITFGLSNRDGKPTILITRLLKTGRVKVESNFYFRSVERADEWLANWKSQKKAILEAKEKRKEEKKSFTHDVKVGDVLYSSWGYEQTNINFFQVVKVSAKSVWFREIYGNKVEGDYMSGKTTPIKDSFKGKDTHRRVVRKGNYVSFDHHSLSQVEEGRSYSYSTYH